VQVIKAIYLQIKGTAMGTPVAVCYADMVLTYLESSLLSTPGLLYYRRYLDDLLLLGSYNAIREIFEGFQSKCDSIQLDAISIDHSGIFLDIKLKLENGTIITQVYQKPTHKYTYIPPTSEHNAKIFKGFIQSELRRYTILTTKLEDYVNIKGLFYQRLLQRGYKMSYLAHIFSCDFNRSELLNNLLLQKHLGQQQNSESKLVFVAPPMNQHTRIPWKNLLQLSPSLCNNKTFKQIYENPRIIIAQKQSQPAYKFFVTHNIIKDIKNTVNHNFDA
jgi:hypothetical protein